LGWTDDPKADRKIADTPFYRHLTYRDMAKKLGHGSNYRGLPPTMARHAKLPVVVAEQFQTRYFERFSGIPKWHRWVAQQLQTSNRIITPFGRERTFFGRANDDSTLREAIAFSPQSATAERLNLVLWRVWKHMPQVQLIAQVHDALYFQYPEHLNEVDIISEALSHFDLAFEKDGHQLVVPGEAKVGWNWGNFDPDSNPDGLAKWKNKKDERRRTPLLSQKL
jgi:DNA polymerase I-like protein with 3'-5' exonuclease and polymerase domains